MIVLDEDQLLFRQDHGYIIYKTFQNECYIDYVQINPGYRRRGFGTKIVNDFIDSMTECNIFFLEAYFNAEMNEKNTSLDFFKLVSFYEQLGFDKDEIAFEALDLDYPDDLRIFLQKVM